jgi:uncharacterized protein YjbJ (UPF0337 family)
MNITEEKGNRQKQNGALKQRFASLTENDQLFKEGIEEEELGNRQIRLGKTEEELDKIIAGL